MLLGFCYYLLVSDKFVYINIYYRYQFKLYSYNIYLTVKLITHA